jgi:hypothetical protein
MEYKEWLNLFGRDSEDNKLKDALAKVGVKKVPTIKKDETETRVELADSMLIFASGAFYPSRDIGGDGSSLLSGLILPLKGYDWGEYKGELPFQLDRADSRKTLRARLGEPLEQNDRFRWDQWKVDNLMLRVTYAKDFESLTAVSIKLPTEV